MNFKKIKSVLLVSVVCFSIVVTGCNKNSDSANSQRNSKSKEASNEDLLSNTTFEINVSKLLENKNSLIGDNTSSINIASNLPINANYNYEGIELKTKEKPYELIIIFKELSENK
ncbi:MAG: DUF4825 domain-containing protein [Clostridioides sp.]|jgi:type 1 fimbria pilin|nr:DUF4825 domain-containing protein [Clostridioides sp.]